MKKVLIVFPLAVMLANCSSSRKSGSSAGMGSNGSVGATTSRSTNSDVSASGTTGTSSSASIGTMSDSVSGNSAGSSTATTSSGTTGTAGSGSVATSSTSGNSAGSATSGTTTATTSATTNSSSTSSGVSGATNHGSNSSGWNSASTSMQSSVGMPSPTSGYDPHNYMQNPDKYLSPYLLTKTGGWTYSTDWRRNTNYSAEAEGNWQLVMTPEVASAWRRDTSHPESYASYWTPEAVAARQDALMAAAQRTSDSIRAIDSIAAMANASNKYGRSGSGKYSRMHKGSHRMTASAGMRHHRMNAGGSEASASSSTGSSSTNDNSATATTGSGTTGNMGTGGMSDTKASSAIEGSSSGMDSTGSFSTSYLKAVNGNNFMLPDIHLYMGNGTLTAYTGCNDAVGMLTVNGSSLQFTQATPSSNIQCLAGFDQSAFLDRLSRADNYDVVNNQLRLKQGDQVLMVFAKQGQ